jgi:cell division protease FtsH
MEKHQRFSVWYVILGVWGVLIIHNLLFSAIAIETIPYSDCLNLLQEDKKELLKKCAALLLEKETLDGDELRALIEAA